MSNDAQSQRRRPDGSTRRPASSGEFPVEQALARIQAATAGLQVPVVTSIAQNGGDPFRVLVSTVLSLRTQDRTTALASRRLFDVADTPDALWGLDEARIAELIYPVGFYKTKAASLRRIARILLDEHGGAVPPDLEALLKLPGVGRKTANLVLTEGFGLPGICVDTHVHRIPNRWGYIRTQTPEQTELRLRKRLPGRWWIPINQLLVSWGQHVCTPVSPWCSRCAVADLCRRVGVGRRRR